MHDFTSDHGCGEQVLEKIDNQENREPSSAKDTSPLIASKPVSSLDSSRQPFTELQLPAQPITVRMAPSSRDPGATRSNPVYDSDYGDAAFDDAAQLNPLHEVATDSLSVGVAGSITPPTAAMSHRRRKSAASDMHQSSQTVKP